MVLLCVCVCVCVCLSFSMLQKNGINLVHLGGARIMADTKPAAPTPASTEDNSFPHIIRIRDNTKEKETEMVSTLKQLSTEVGADFDGTNRKTSQHDHAGNADQTDVSREEKVEESADGCSSGQEDGGNP